MPVKVPGISGVTDIATMQGGTCVVVHDSTVSCWGTWTRFDDAPDSDSDRVEPQPYTVAGTSGARSVQLGGGYACAVLASGTMRCWGNDRDDQIGAPDSATTMGVVLQPFDVTRATAISQVALLGATNCVLHGSGNVRCWGRDIAANLDSVVDLPVRGAIDLGLTYGVSHVYVITSDHVLHAWENDHKGSLLPFETAPLEALQISGGEFAACALAIDSSVHCWGDDASATGMPIVIPAR